MKLIYGNFDRAEQDIRTRRTRTKRRFEDKDLRKENVKRWKAERWADVAANGGKTRIEEDEELRSTILQESNVISREKSDRYRQAMKDQLKEQMNQGGPRKDWTTSQMDNHPWRED
jgi:hypothetical protein